MSFTEADLAAAAETEHKLRLAGRNLSPSNIPVWRGTRRQGDKFTGEQLRRLRHDEIDETTVDTILIASNVTAAELPRDPSKPPERLIWTCPILERRRGGKLRVYAPSGFTAWVYADGSITKVRK